MRKRILFLVLLILGFLVGCVPLIALAHQTDTAPTTFYACEEPTAAAVIPDSITADATPVGSCSDAKYGPSAQLVQWNAVGSQGPAGPQGTPGTNGLDGSPGPQGPVGPTGPKGDAGIPFSHAACTDTGLSGSAQQENLIFCQSGIEPDGGLVYKTAIAAAKVRIMVGTPIADFQSVDWSGAPITYIEFTSGLHAEYHADQVVRIYNTANQRVF